MAAPPPGLKKFELKLSELDLNRISQLDSIKILEKVESVSFLSDLFSIDNVKFNKHLNSEKALDINSIESE